MKHHRRTISLLTTIAMLIYLLPSFTLTTHAASEHIHCVCGGNTAIGDHTTHTEITFTEWTSTDSLPTTAGIYVLTNDVTISYIWAPADGTVLCLNGHTLKTTNTSSGSSVIEVSNSNTFTLCDCQDNTGVITGGNNNAIEANSGTFYMYGGTLTGNGLNAASSMISSGLLVTGSAIVTMYDGIITQNCNRDSRDAGGVANFNSFTIYGGSITDNYGHGVYNSSGSFIMNGGEISKHDLSGYSSFNDMNAGAGVYNSSRFYMIDGVIKNNTAENAGGGIVNRGTIEMSGGSVTNNKSVNSSGGGIWSSGSGSITISGSVNISDNTAKGANSNLHLAGDGTTDAKITIGEDGIDEKVLIGVSVDDNHGKVICDDGADYIDTFFSDNIEYEVVVDGTSLKLAEHTHSYTDGFCNDCGAYEPATANSDGVYEIVNPGQLYWFASLVSGDVTQEDITAADTGANAILTTDIDLDGKEWTPIGTKAAPYTGVFDGNGYTISGLSITTEAEYIGLFGYVEEGTVKDLTISGTIDVEGDTIFAGGIVGTIRNGVLSNLISKVDVTGTTDTKGTFGGVAATVEGTDKTAGSTMENCANYGDVTASGVLDCTGGLVGYMNSATINNCANYGKVDTIGATAQQNEGVYTAGIVSYINNATAVITNCINVGTISGAAESEDYDRYTGAIVGRIKNNVGEITNVYYLDTSADESCAANASGIELDITAKTADELASGEVTYLLQNSASDSVWGQDLESDTYPTLYKTNVVKVTFIGDSTVERYANAGIVPTNYPTPATGVYAFYTDSAFTNRIDTSAYTFTADTTVYMAQMYTVTQNLTNVTSDNASTEVIPGSEFTANLTAADGYVIKSVTVTMGNSDITNTAYSNGTVNISSVNGDIVITAIVVEKTVEINGVTVNSNSVDVEITNTLGASGTVIVAVYDANDALVDLAAVDLADGTVSVSVDTANAATVSAYIWDGTSTMIPLCDKYTVTN